MSRFPANYAANAVPPVPEYPAQRADYSYGSQTSGALCYFSPPKPNAVNGTITFTAVVARVNVSVGLETDAG